MASINPLARELVLKIVFYGPGLGGKTTTLQHIHDMARPEHRGKMVSLATAVDRTLYFDFLPLRVPKPLGLGIRLQLFTVPGQVYYNSTRKLVLTGADGLVFVADSQTARQDANLESLENLVENLREQKRDLSDLPHVFLYNKRDLDDILPVEEMERELNLYQAPSFATIATRGTGVFEGLARILKVSLAGLQRTLPPDSGTPDLSAEFPEEILPWVLRGEQPTPSARGVAIVSQNVLEAPEPRWSDAPPPPPSQEVPLTDISAAPTLTSGRPGLSFAALWPETDRELLLEIEAHLAAGEYPRALEGMDVVLSRIFASAGALLRTNDVPREPAVIPLLLGLSGTRYLAFRSLLRDARAGLILEERSVLAAYAFVLEVRLARDRLTLG
ncbi:MAG: GTPase domain-containing protein [Polyangiaceae bacterium]|nr:GTPase domain-containing protein [Polyangiaceae bacterium]